MKLSRCQVHFSSRLNKQPGGLEIAHSRGDKEHTGRAFAKGLVEHSPISVRQQNTKSIHVPQYHQRMQSSTNRISHYKLAAQKKLQDTSQKKIPSRGLTYPTLGKGKASSKVPFKGDMLVPTKGTNICQRHPAVDSNIRDSCRICIPWLKSSFRHSTLPLSPASTMGERKSSTIRPPWVSSRTQT